MVLEYTLAGDKPTTVSFSVTANGKKYTADSLHLEGDYGKNIAPGKRRLVWNVLQDFSRGLQGKVDWSLTAGGGGGTDPTTGMEFVAVPGGCFQMGDTFGDRESDEKPVHQVCVSDFSIGKYEVTQGQWKAVMDSNPSRFSSCGDNCPVESVSWDDAQQFIRRLNKQSSTSYRLPTEAEWEYAARSGGKREKYSGGNDVDAVAWYYGNSAKTHSVGQKQPNGLGIFDMSGNVWEWCSDWFGGYSSRIQPAHHRAPPAFFAAAVGATTPGRAVGSSFRARPRPSRPLPWLPPCLAFSSVSQARFYLPLYKRGIEGDCVCNAALCQKS
jgi:formylglycine-generating enzyme required for sulfatase activity